MRKILVTKLVVISVIASILLSGCVEISIGDTPIGGNPGAVLEETVPSDKSDSYAYTLLSDETKALYDTVLTAVKGFRPQIKFRQPPELEQLISVYSMIFGSETNLQYMSATFKYDSDPVSVMMLSYTETADSVKELQTETGAAAALIILESEGLSDYEKLKLFHDRIIESCDYDLEEKYQMYAYGALVLGRATCQGYANAFALLCSAAGIENILVKGTAGEAHMWNKVKLGEAWYNIDVTWDDPDKAGTPGLILYDYLLVPDEDLSARELSPSLVEYPIADSLADNYYSKNSLLVTSPGEAKNLLYNIYLDAVAEGSTYVSIKCDSAETYSDVVTDLFDNKEIFKLQRYVNLVCGDSLNAGKVSYMKNNETKTITLNIILGGEKNALEN